jgi:hypothetical protein
MTWRVDLQVQSDHTIHVWPDDDIIEHDLGPGPCICQPFLEEQPSGRVMVCHHSLDGRELAEPDHGQDTARS